MRSFRFHVLDFVYMGDKDDYNVMSGSNGRSLGYS